MRTLAVLSIALLGSVQPLAAQATADPQALHAESLMVEAMGGRAAWNSARFLDFVWASERDGTVRGRRHVWDRWTGRYKLELEIGGGQQVVAVFNVNTRAGDVWIDGVALTPDSAAPWLERAYAIHINDAYWFIMPFKWRDDGVNLTHMGVVTDAAGKRWEKIQLTFGNVGLTPDNRYYCYLDTDTHLMGWWEHFRHRDDPEPALASRWSQWEMRGPVRVSLDRPFLSSASRILFPAVTIGTTVPDGAFAPPRP